MPERRSPEEIAAEYAEKERLLKARLAAARKKAAAVSPEALARLREKLALVGRRRELAEARSRQSPRKADTQAKIVVGAIAMSYLAEHPEDRWFRSSLLKGLKANPKTKRNPLLLAFARSLVAGKEEHEKH